MLGKIIDVKSGLCSVGLGSDIAFYKSIGFIELDIKQSDIDNNYYLVNKCPMKTNIEKIKEEQERIAKLHLTKREVFLGFYKAMQITPEKIKEHITTPEALIEFEYANEYYRGNPLINDIGSKLGITAKQLDNFFATKDYKKLLEN